MSRSVLPERVSRDVVIHQMANVGAMVSACFTGDVALFGRAIDDRIAEPARAPFCQGFIDAKRAALGCRRVRRLDFRRGAERVRGDPRTIERPMQLPRRCATRTARRVLECATRVTRVDAKGAIVSDGPSSR